MKILVIVDMQNDFINGALGTPEAQAAVGDVAKKISGFDGDLICITKDTHRSADYLKTQEGQLLPVEHCIEGTHGWRLDDIIATAISHAAIDAGEKRIRIPEGYVWLCRAGRLPGRTFCQNEAAY